MCCPVCGMVHIKEPLLLNEKSSPCSGSGFPMCGMVHIKEPLLLFGKSSPCSGGSGFPFSLSEWSFTICSTPYNRKENVLSASLNKTCPSFLLGQQDRWLDEKQFSQASDRD